ncbi:MAG: hypothetical protein QM696_07050 [Steroidobacteraceae bacterium]
MRNRFKGFFAGLRSPQAPKISSNTFLVWEPCTHSHAEVLPGYVKYLLDLGYDVSVLATPERFDEGLFARFSDPRITLNRLSQRAIRRHFAQNALGGARGILITTARKISGAADYAAELALFADRDPGQKVLLVEHDVRKPMASGALHPGIITLRKVGYQGCATAVVNPHFFGTVRVAPRRATVNFITIGALQGKRRNTALLIEAAAALHARGLADFRITVIGRGGLRSVPAELQSYFDILGSVDFARMYDAVESADFFLPLLDPGNPRHERYITSSTSGSFQLIYGFRKPCLIERKFAAINGFDSSNSLIYDGNEDLPSAMTEAMNLPQSAYVRLQEGIGRYANSLYEDSLEQLSRLVWD